MIFYLAIAIIVAVFIYNTFIKRYADIEDGFMYAFITLVGLLIVVPIIAGVSPKETKQAATWTQPLVQIDEYRYAGNIYIENDPTEVEYVYKDARGSLVLGEVAGHDSTIREVAKTFNKPTVTVTATDHFNHWVLPWNMYTTYHYDFKVPAGSVMQEVESVYDADEHGDD